jgi:hypothetical protein
MPAVKLRVVPMPLPLDAENVTDRQVSQVDHARSVAACHSCRTLSGLRGPFTVGPDLGRIGFARGRAFVALLPPAGMVLLRTIAFVRWEIVDANEGPASDLR